MVMLADPARAALKRGDVRVAPYGRKRCMPNQPL
jgi:hypothetical protein